MRLRVVRSICLPRQVMTERGFFYCVGCNAIARGVPICASLSRNGPDLSRLYVGVYLNPKQKNWLFVELKMGEPPCQVGMSERRKRLINS